MFTDSTLKPIKDDEQYVSPDGTQYPWNFPKEDIAGLFPVTMTAQPSNPSKVVTGFHINAQHQQVWDTRDKTPTELNADAQIAMHASLGGFDSVGMALADIRWKKEVGGITLDMGGNAIPLLTDRETQLKLIAIRIKAVEDGSYTVNWKSAAGFLTLDAPTIITVADTIAAHVQNCFGAEMAVLADGQTYTTYNNLKMAFDLAYGALPFSHIGMEYRVIFDENGNIQSETIVPEAT